MNTCNQNDSNPISHATRKSTYGMTVKGGCPIIESLTVLDSQIINHHTQIRVQFTGPWYLRRPSNPSYMLRREKVYMGCSSILIPPNSIKSRNILKVLGYCFCDSGDFEAYVNNSTGLILNSWILLTSKIT